MQEENVKAALDETTKIAEDMMKDEDQTRSFLNDLESKLGDFPKLESVMDDIKMVIRLMRDVIDKKYTTIPAVSIAALMGALVYLLKPRDLIPDSIPVLGQLDDIAVVALALKLCSGDIEEYKKWLEREKNGNDSPVV